MDYDYDKILVIRCKYSSYYTKCIYGEEHEGYLLLIDDIKPSNLTFEVMRVSDFLSN